MATTTYLSFTILPPTLFPQQEKPNFCLELTLRHKYIRQFRNLQGQVAQINSYPVDQSSSLFQIHSWFLSHSSTCYGLLYSILSSFNVDVETRHLLARDLAANLITARAQIVMDFHCVAVIEIIHQEFIDAQELLMMITTMDGAMVVETRRGVSRSKMKKMEKGSFTAEESRGGECVICLEELSGKVKVIKTNCAHIFHKNCIFRWLKNHNSCPMCRRKVEI